MLEKRERKRCSAGNFAVFLIIFQPPFPLLPPSGGFALEGGIRAQEINIKIRVLCNAESYPLSPPNTVLGGRREQSKGAILTSPSLRSWHPTFFHPPESSFKSTCFTFFFFYSLYLFRMKRKREQKKKKKNTASLAPANQLRGGKRRERKNYFARRINLY
jgi:hypothetical protein